VALSLKEKILDHILFYLVSFAGGAILGAAFFDLIPEAIELIEIETAIVYISVGFLFFFLLERSIYWYHGHGHFHNSGHISISAEDTRTEVKSYVYLNLIGDGVHNFIDGLVIGASFLISIPAGIVTTLAVFFHELPQEIGDFAILVYGGMKRIKALMMNFITALMAIVGVLIVYFILSSPTSLGFLVGFAGGGFTYIAAAELIPELQKEKKVSKSIIQFIIFILAMILIWSLSIFFHE
jgi:zinc and cadmium transporter